MVEPPRSAPGAPPRQSGLASAGPQSLLAGKDSSGRPATASPLPLIVAIASVVLGALDLLLLDESSGVGTAYTGLFGYLLSGFVPPLMLGWDATAQRRGVKNPNFRPRRAFSVGLRIVVLVGFVIAIIHLLAVADVLALRMSEWLFVQGWVTL